MQIKRIIFIRSGETEWNRLGRWQGWVASPLNAHGRHQVSKLANFLRNIGIGVLYSSDLQRAKDTAAVMNEKIDVPVHFDERLRERSIGHWQGMTPDELRTWYPGEFQALLTDMQGYRLPGGESLDDVYARMKAAFDAITAADAAETVGVISHTVSIRTLLSGLLGEFQYGQRLRNSSVTTIRFDESAGRWVLVASDDIEHLEGLSTMSATEAGEEAL
jgi:broad specificity phosphatase PhoE